MNYNLKQAIEEISENGYKFVSLYRNGEQITKFNQAGKFDGKLDEISKRIEKFPGSYVIMAKFNQADKPDQFVINGENVGIAENAINLDVNPKHLENQKVLALSIENEKLKMQNANYLRDIDELENTIAELENTIVEMQANAIESTTPTLMENAQNFLSTLMEYGAPLLDQHFALKKQQLEIERMKFGGPRPQTKADPEKVAIRIIGQWVETKQNDPELYQQLHDISANSQNVNDFLTQLQQFNTDLYEEISKQL